MKKTAFHITSLPTDYTSLVAHLPPRPIRTKAEYQRIIKMIDTMAGHALTDDQEDYLEALSLMVEAYESRRREARLASVGPLDLLRHLMEAADMNVSALGQVVGSQPLASLILLGKRPISRMVALRLARHFSVTPALFISDATTTRKAG